MKQYTRVKPFARVNQVWFRIEEFDPIIRMDISAFTSARLFVVIESLTVCLEAAGRWWMRQ